MMGKEKQRKEKKRKEKEGNIIEEMDRTLHHSRTFSFYNNYERLIRV